MGASVEQEGAGGGRAGQLNLFAETTNPLGGKCDGFGRNAPVYRVYPVSRTTSDERAECSRGWGWGGVGTKGFFTSIRSHRCRGLLYAWF